LAFRICDDLSFYDFLGTIFKDECPVENMIPIYLIVTGSAGVVANCCSCFIGRNRDPDSGEIKWEAVHPDPCKIFLQFFLFVWFICGNVWIYRNYQPNYDDPESTDYCNKTLYLFAFWATNSYYIIFVLVLIGIIAFWTCQITMCDKVIIFDESKILFKNKA